MKYAIQRFIIPVLLIIKQTIKSKKVARLRKSIQLLSEAYTISVDYYLCIYFDITVELFVPFGDSKKNHRTFNQWCYNRSLSKIHTLVYIVFIQVLQKVSISPPVQLLSLFIH